MDIKTELLKITQSNVNLRATLRWLHKSNPDIWQSILECTSFLPATSSAPQRVWHILNDVFEIQLCPITNKPLGWICFEHGYKKYGDKKTRYEEIAKLIQETVNTEGHWRKKNPDKAIRANEKFSIGLKLGEHKPFKDRNRDYEASLAAARKTWLKKIRS